MKRALTASSAFLILAVLFVPGSSKAAKDLSEICNLIERQSLRSEARRHTLTHRLLDEIDELCETSLPPKLLNVGRTSKNSVKTDVPSPSFPISRPSFRTRTIPHCPLETPPLDITCGDAVPRSCTWLCQVGNELRRYPKR